MARNLLYTESAGATKTVLQMPGWHWQQAFGLWQVCIYKSTHREQMVAAQLTGCKGREEESQERYPDCSPSVACCSGWEWEPQKATYR